MGSPSFKPRADTAFRVAHWSNAVLMDIEGAVEIANVRETERIYSQLVERYPQLVVLCVVRRAVPVASRQVRTEGAEVARRFAKRIVHAAVVIEETGLVADLLRTVLRTFSAVSRPTRIQVYASVEYAVRGLRPSVVSDASDVDVERELMRIFEGLRREGG